MGGQILLEIEGQRLRLRTSGDWRILARGHGGRGPSGLEIQAFRSAEALADAATAALRAADGSIEGVKLGLNLSRSGYERLRGRLKELAGGRPWEVFMSLRLTPRARAAVAGRGEEPGRPPMIPLIAWTECHGEGEEMRLVGFHADLVVAEDRGYRLVLSCNDIDDRLLRERAASALPELEFSTP